MSAAWLVNMSQWLWPEMAGMSCSLVTTVTDPIFSVEDFACFLPGQVVGTVNPFIRCYRPNGQVAGFCIISHCLLATVTWMEFRYCQPSFGSAPSSLKIS